jgi:hypothetical protein
MRRPDLVSDCVRCAAICCIVTSFDASEDFAFDKPAGVGCHHLTHDCRCAIHDDLAIRGLRGCATYDCYGAGPRVTRALDATDAQRDDVFRVLRAVHELLWQLTEAAKLCPHEPLRAQLEQEIATLDRLATDPITAVVDIDLRPRRAAARALLDQLATALGSRARASRALAVTNDAPAKPPKIA